MIFQSYKHECTSQLFNWAVLKNFRKDYIVVKKYLIMKVTKMFAFSFSPSGTTENVIKNLSENLSNCEYFDISKDNISANILESELIIFGTPVYDVRHIYGNI